MFPIGLAQMLGWACLALTCVAAAWRGGPPEKLGASLSAAAWVVSTLVERRHNWLEPQFGIFAVDVVMLFALIALAFWSRRYWAIWAAGFQAIGVLTHLLFLINPAALYRAYYMSNFSIAFLVLGAIVAGVIFESAKSPVISRR
jgi:hypothetical protein